ncbi:hypothetical protein ACFPOI_23685 [Nonomuraea angiospora]|uniref:Uncharacterized protein n=1 Tax=Nonomuraea angiospora TaxID=46172 RepID=A0ABR9ML84_9ACTN|nr:hypothetical protein [Nonomuraea angiospora]MBE1593678.1 hypothetical protein [Nonomuraea angiospora]
MGQEAVDQRGEERVARRRPSCPAVDRAMTRRSTAGPSGATAHQRLLAFLGRAVTSETAR